MTETKGREARGARIRASMLTTVALVALLQGAVPQMAGAQAAQAVTVNIPAQDLGRALTRLGDQTGVNIIITSDLSRGRHSPALRGSYTLEAALDLILAGSGLVWQAQGSTVTITMSGAGLGVDGTQMLGQITLGGTGPGISPALQSAETYLGTGTSAYVSQEQILNARGLSVGDMLSGIPGVMNAENRGSGALDVNIRGMQGQGRTPVVIDGAMQETSVYRGYAGMAGRSYLDPDLLGGISIEKGPSTGPDAAGAIGGILRARTLSPNDIIAADGTWGLRVITGATGNNSTPPPGATIGGTEQAVRNFDRPSFADLRGYNASAVLAYRFDKVDVLLGYTKRDIGNYHAGSKGRDPSRWDAGAHPFGFGEEVTNTSGDSNSWLLRSVIRPNSDHTIDLSYMRYDTLLGEMKPSQLMYGEIPYQTTSTVLAETYTARYRYDPDSPLIDLRADLWATRVDSFVVDPIRFVYGDYYDNSDKFAATLSDRIGLTLHNTSRFDTQMGAVSLNYGFAIDHEDFGRSKDADRLVEAHPGAEWDTVREGKRTQKSAFLSLDFRPADWATFTAGARYTQNVVQDSKAGWSWAQGGLINHEEVSGWAPSFSALIEPVKGVQFYSRYAEALRAASPFEATEGFTGSVNPYSDLRMEHAHNTEIGVNLLKSGIFTEDDVFQAKLGWFNNSVTDYITLGSERLTAPNGNYTDMLVRTNIPLVELRGIEISGRYDMGRVWGEFGMTEYDSVKSCYADVPGRNPECHQGPDPTSNSWFMMHIPPKRSFSGTIGTRLFDENLALATRYTHIKSDTPYELVDVFGSYRVNDNVALSFAVDNVFDKYYIDTLTLGQGMAMPASPGRTLRLSFIATLGDGTRSKANSAEDRADIAALTGMSAAAKTAFDGDWSGYHAGLLWGAAHYSSSGSTRAGNGSALPIATTEASDRASNTTIAGLQFGRDWQSASGLVWGIETDLHLGRARATQGIVSTELDVDRWGANDTYQARYDQSFGPSATLRLRLGKSFGRTLVYGTGGLGLIEESLTRTQMRSGGLISGPYFSETDSKWRAGVVLGAGAEYAISNSLSMKAEYLYGNYPARDFDFTRAGSGVGSAAAGDGTGRQVGSKLESHSLRIGLNYRF